MQKQRHIARKVAAVCLFTAIGLAVPASAIALDQSNDAARIASQKHNAKRSQKEARQRKRAMKKAVRAAGRPKTPEKRTSQTLN